MKDIYYLPDDFKNAEFYPTPPILAHKMLRPVNWRKVTCVLEPSAGKGDLADEIKAAYKGYYRDMNETTLDIDCIEQDTNLQHILRGKGYRVVHDDFLTFHTYKQYDLIVMNPPFSVGDKHLLKAMELLSNGGQVICLLNAETLKNPYSATRQKLKQLLEEYSANIEYVEGAFSKAERKTGVEIAIVAVDVPKQKNAGFDSFYEHLKKAEKRKEKNIEAAAQEITFYDLIKNMEAEYVAEVETGIDLIEHYRAVSPYIKDSMDPDDHYKSPILELKIEGSSRHGLSINRFIEKVRMKYWSYLFSNSKFMGHLTSELQTSYRSMVEKLKDYDFSEYNIKIIMLEMNAKLNESIQDAIVAMFDRLTAEHSWYPESKKNKHYYNGWASNLAHKVNKKVILPCYEVFSPWNKEFRSYQAIYYLRDIEKIFDFLDGNMTRHVNLEHALSSAGNNPKNIKCKYFTVSFYKKGTVHIKFDNLELLDRFNIYVAQNRNWLPPSYGKQQYNAMTAEEKAVIDEFQGKEEYKKVYESYERYMGIPLLNSFSLIGNGV